MLRVVDTSAWPSISDTTLTATPFDSRRVAAECLESCIRVLAGRPARSSNGFQERLWRLWTLMGVPTQTGFSGPEDGLRSDGYLPLGLGCSVLPQRRYGELG